MSLEHRGAAAADITYIYDGLGRLVGVADPASDTAVYHYDAVGNLLSISRQSSALVSIVDVRPGSGPVGASVTISGTGFSPAAGQNMVTFNGTAAAVTSATSTQLQVTVPHPPTFSGAELKAICERRGGWWRGKLMAGYREYQSASLSQAP